jgi:glycine dehydrogenase subunit 2
VKTAPHYQPIHRIKTDWLDDPARWAMTYRAYVRKHGAPRGRARGE